MNNSNYIYDSGKINEYLHLVDIKQYNKERVCSIFIAEFDNCSLILDCGTSFDVNRLLRYMKRNEISLSSVKYIIPTHHHFDHAGGLWKLYNNIKEVNSDVKILCSDEFKRRINNFEHEPHFILARKTYGGLIGNLKPINDEAFKIIDPKAYLNIESNHFNIIESFSVNDRSIGVSLLETPGHSEEHVSPCFIINNEIDFIFFGDALGLKSNKDKLITGPTSPPPNFNYQVYMQSVEKLKKLNPLNAGFSHSGYVKGTENVNYLIDEHRELMINFRKRVMQYYSENPSTEYVFEKIFPWLRERTDVGEDYIMNPIIQKLSLSMVYGMLVDLGYRNV